MVPAHAEDEHSVHAAEVAARFMSLKDLVPDLTYGEIDVLLGMRSRGHARQIAEEGKVPGVPKARKFAALFGASPEWLLLGVGKPPGRRRARGLVAEARLRLGGVHQPKVPARKPSRKRNTRTGPSAIHAGMRTARP